MVQIVNFHMIQILYKMCNSSNSNNMEVEVDIEVIMYNLNMEIIECKEDKDSNKIDIIICNREIIITKIIIVVVIITIE